MNRALLIPFLFLAIPDLLLAQAPNAFKFQTAVRDASGQLMADRAITLRISILAGEMNGEVRYAETHAVTTNAQGLAALNVGAGAPDQGDWTAIDWATQAHFMRIELDPAGGANFQLMGTSQLLSVPYALHATTAEQVDDADPDPTNELELPTTAQPGDLAFFDGASWQSLPPGQEGQVLTIANGFPSWVTPSNEVGGEDPVIDTEKCTKEYNGFTLIANDVRAQSGQQVCITICAANFQDILAMSFIINYDDRILTFDTITNVIFPNVNQETYGQFFTTPLSNNPTEPGSIQVAWSSPNLQPFDLEYGSTLFQLCFTVASPTEARFTPISFSGGQNPIDILTVNFQPVPYTLVNGFVAIENP